MVILNKNGQITIGPKMANIGKNKITYQVKEIQK